VRHVQVFRAYRRQDADHGEAGIESGRGPCAAFPGSFQSCRQPTQGVPPQWLRGGIYLGVESGQLRPDQGVGQAFQKGLDDWGGSQVGRDQIGLELAPSDLVGRSKDTVSEPAFQKLRFLAQTHPEGLEVGLREAGCMDFLAHGVARRTGGIQA